MCVCDRKASILIKFKIARAEVIAKQEQVRSLPIDILESLGEALLDFTGIEDLDIWLLENVSR